MPGGGQSSSFPTLPRQLSTERTILRLIHESGGRAGGPDPRAVAAFPRGKTTALFMLLGSRPYTASAVLEELLARGPEASWGRSIARGAANRLGLESGDLLSGGNFTERLGPVLHALRSLELLEPVSVSGQGRGSPRGFRLRPEGRDLVYAVLRAFCDGEGLPWVQGSSTAVARYHLARASHFSWNREFRSAERELGTARSFLRSRGEAGADASARLSALGDADLQLAGIQQSGGSWRRARRALVRARRSYERALALDPDDGRSRVSLSQCLLRQGEIDAFAGRLRDAGLAVRRSLELLTARVAGEEKNWEAARDLAMGRVVLGEIQLFAGDAGAAARSLEQADRELNAAGGRSRELLAGRARANLAMNQGRLAVVQAVAQAVQGRVREARKYAVRATTRTSRATQLVRRQNPVIERRLGIAIRTRVELSLELGVPERRSDLVARGLDAFDRSLRLSPEEPDTLLECSRLLRLRDRVDLADLDPSLRARMAQRAAAVDRALRSLRRAGRARAPSLASAPDADPRGRRSRTARRDLLDLLPRC